MIRAYAKVSDVIDYGDSIIVKMTFMKSGYSHVRNDEELDALDIVIDDIDFSVRVDKRLRNQFDIGKVSMIDWFRVCPKGWEK